MRFNYLNTPNYLQILRRLSTGKCTKTPWKPPKATRMYMRCPEGGLRRETRAVSGKVRHFTLPQARTEACDLPFIRTILLSSIPARVAAKTSSSMCRPSASPPLSPPGWPSSAWALRPCLLCAAAAKCGWPAISFNRAPLGRTPAGLFLCWCASADANRIYPACLLQPRICGALCYGVGRFRRCRTRLRSSTRQW